MRAIDLYAGVGGWSLGLRLSGIEVVGSYEWWQPAVDTHNKNHRGTIRPTNVRELDINELPANIDIVVGSPPCTEFSYSNRGGNGDLPEGMKDLARFFEIVRHLNPKWWAMENVPRVATVLREAKNDPEHALHKYRDLFPVVDVIDFSDYGTPQVRRRCIAGNYPLTTLWSFKRKMPAPTLGEVVTAVGAAKNVVDPTWGISIEASRVTDREVEHHLSEEELRMNQESKMFHPVYNDMAFPDDLERSSRTVTATCTRVSRESIIILDPRPGGGHRRLSIRERASLQGFPITYQFFGRSFGEKAKLVGNAIPPTFTYLLGMALQAKRAENLGDFPSSSDLLSLPAELPLVTKPEGRGRTYPRTRTFRAALPGLRFKSGMRFELANSTDEANDSVSWAVRFFYGASKDFQQVYPKLELVKDLSERLPEIAACVDGLAAEFDALIERLEVSSPAKLQAVWSHHAQGSLGPYDVSDSLGRIARLLSAGIVCCPGLEAELARYVVAKASGQQEPKSFPGRGKLEHHAVRVLSGFVVAGWFNDLGWHRGFNRVAQSRSGHPKAGPRARHAKGNSVASTGT